MDYCFDCSYIVNFCFLGNVFCVGAFVERIRGGKMCYFILMISQTVYIVINIYNHR